MIIQTIPLQPATMFYGEIINKDDHPIKAVRSFVELGFLDGGLAEEINKILIGHPEIDALMRSYGSHSIVHRASYSQRGLYYLIFDT